MACGKFKTSGFSVYITGFFLMSVLYWIYDVVSSWLIYPPYKLQIDAATVLYAMFAGACMLLAAQIFRLIGKAGKDINPTPILLIVMSVVIFGFLEYFMSLGFEKLFGYIPKNYGGRLFNINGRICCESCVSFAAFEFIYVYVANPLVRTGLSKLGRALQRIISAVIIILTLLFLISAVKFLG